MLVYFIKKKFTFEIILSLRLKKFKVMILKKANKQSNKEKNRRE